MISIEEEKRYAELQAIALDAARQGEAAVLRPMLEAGLPINLRDEKGNTLLMLAAYHGHAPTVALLIDQGADPDARNDRDQTPLAGVAFKGHLAVARQLLAGGADPQADQGGGRTPEMFAAMFGHQAMVGLLREAAGDGNRSNRLLGLPTQTLAKITAAVRAGLIDLFGRKEAQVSQNLV